MIWKTSFASALLFTACLTACQLIPVKCDRDCQQNWLDGGAGHDTADLVSVRIANPTDADKEKHVVIACHGFTATSYEWEEFQKFARTDTSILVSRILLGGHGTDIEDFETTTWQDWGKPIMAEYIALVHKGYRHISLIGSSTGGTLILQDIHDHAFDTLPKPEYVFLIDPFVVPANKMLALVKILGPIVGSSPSTLDSGEKKHWYTNRPAAQLGELNDLGVLMKQELKQGFNLPSGTQCTLWRSDGDPTVDTVSGSLIYKGLHNANGSGIDMNTVHSHLHVFTRLQGRNKVTAADSALQLKTFTEIDSLIKQ